MSTRHVAVRSEWSESSLPARFEATASYSDTKARMKVVMSFAGERVEVESVTVTGAVTPSALARLRLAEVVHRASVDVGRLGMYAEPAWVLPDDGFTGPTPGPRLRGVLALYEFHAATWGNPRRAIMEHYGCARSTANRWMRIVRQPQAV